MSNNISGGYGTPFSVLLFILSAVFILISIGMFLVGWKWYVDPSFIDYQRNLLTSSESKWLALLFAIPPLLQSAGLVAMFPRVHRDRSLVTPYGICMFIMSLCPLSYCLFWMLYTWNPVMEETSYWALLCIVILLFPVALITYALMWTRNRTHKSNGDWQLIEAEIPDWQKFFGILKDHQGSLGLYRRKVFELLPNQLRGQILTAQYASEFADIPKAEVLRELNRILQRRDLHLAVPLVESEISQETKDLLIHSQNELTEEEMRQLHYLLLVASSTGSIVELAKPTLEKKWFSIMSLKTNWERLLQNIKTGVVKAHFWVFANFFAVFLGITYLFAFAFAFHDQSLIINKKNPALSMAKRGSSSSAAQQSNEIKPRSQLSDTSKYVFYFDSISAHPTFSNGDFNPLAYRRSSDDTARNKEWRENTNYKRFHWLSEDIVKLTEKGKTLRIALEGHADDSKLKESTTFASNYDLSEARAQNLKYTLITRLEEKDLVRRDIEWLTLAISSELAPQYPLPKDGAAVRIREGMKTKDRPSQRGSSAHNDDLLNRLDDELNRLIEDTRLNDQDTDYIRSKADELRRTIREKQLTWNEILDPRNQIFKLAHLMQSSNRSELTGEEKQRQTERLTRTKEEVQTALDSFEYVDRADAKRVVVVSLIPMEPYKDFAPLALMDYIYFTVYTITTTGYGDIVPVTTYAKFLCSFANILEVFFLVVFFNSLLSVRASSKSQYGR